MKTEHNFTVDQQSAIIALTTAFAASKLAGIPLNAYATDAGIVFPTVDQSKALDKVRRAAKAASRAQLELRITDECPLVVSLVDTTTPACELAY